MNKSIFYERFKTYLFGVAIGSILVAMILLTKADMVKRERARLATQATQPNPADSEQAPDSPHR